MKRCTKCKTKYRFPEKSFNKNRKSKDGFHQHCKKCIAKYHKTHYEDNLSYYKEKARKHNNEYNKRNLQFTIDYLKQHPCVDCGETDPVVLDFDHLKDKKENISWLVCHGAKLELITEEIAKCDVRCANCHRRKTAKQFDWYKDVEL